MSDLSGTGLKEPNQVDWEGLGSSKYTPPPQAKKEGKYTSFFGQLPSTITADVTQDKEYREYLVDPIKLVKNGNGVDGYEIRFTRVSLKPFSNGKGGNKAALMLKAAGVTSKAQKTTEYDAAVNQVRGKVASFTIDWYGKNKDTGEVVRGYDNFPDDPTFPGRKKPIIKQGETYTDAETGETKTLKGEILFANAQVRFFNVPSTK